MNRRGFLSCSALAPFSVAADLLRGRRYRQAPEERPAGRPLPTGLAELDVMLGGGLPQAGVTMLLEREWGCAQSLALNVVNHHLLSGEGPVAYVGGCYNRDRVLDRLAFIRAGLDRFGRRRGLWTARDEDAFREARDQVVRSPLHYEDARRLRSLGDVAASLSRVQRAHGLRVVAVEDAFWFAEGVGPDEPQAAAQALGRGLRDAAALLGVPVVALCPISLDVSGEGSQMSLQPALGPRVGVLEHCAACLAVRCEVIGNEGLSVQVEFHPAASRGDVSFHNYNRGSGRLADWA